MVALLMLRHLANKVGFKEVLFIDEGLAMLDDENLEMMMNLFDTWAKKPLWASSRTTQILRPFFPNA